VKFLYDKWRHVWMLSWERQRELYDHLAYLKEKQKADNFSWDDWRKRFLKFMNYKKSRLTDLFRKMDKDNNELIPRDDFIEGIIKTSESCFLILTARNSVLGVAVCALFTYLFFFRI
jgi:dystonin